MLTRYCVSPVECISISYYLNEKNEICAELSWEEGRDATIIRFLDTTGEEMELIIDAAEHIRTFTEGAYPDVFNDAFEGFVLTHVGPVQRFHNVESLEVCAHEPVPLQLKEAQLKAQLWKLRAQLEDVITRSCKRRRMCEAFAPWRSGRVKKHRRRQVCFLHDPANGRWCNDWNCWRAKDHIDTCTAKGQRRWRALMASIGRRWSERD